MRRSKSLTRDHAIFPSRRPFASALPQREHYILVITAHWPYGNNACLSGVYHTSNFFTAYRLLIILNCFAPPAMTTGLLKASIDNDRKRRARNTCCTQAKHYCHTTSGPFLPSLRGTKCRSNLGVVGGKTWEDYIALLLLLTTIGNHGKICYVLLRYVR